MTQISFKEQPVKPVETAKDLTVGDYAVITSGENKGDIVLCAYSCVVNITNPMKVWSWEYAYMVKVRKIEKGEISIKVGS